MKNLIENTQIRWVFCIAVLAISLLLIGSGRMNGEKKLFSRRVSNLDSCRESANLYSEALPAEYRQAWKKLIETNPELALRAETGTLHEIGTVE